MSLFKIRRLSFSSLPCVYQGPVVAAFVLALLCCVAGFFGSEAASEQKTSADVSLVRGQSVTGRLSNTSADKYLLDLSAGDYCSGVITKNDLRVMVTIEDPTGTELGTFISDNYGNLPFSFVVESSGQY